MSDFYITIIPERPDIMPDTEKQLAAITYFRSIVNPQTDIKISANNCIKFIDCGTNFKNIECPSCSSNIDIKTWQSWMGEDFNGEGFNLNTHKMPCCDTNHTLNELKYQFPQGFARFHLDALNPNINQLSERQLTEFEHILGCAIRVLYRHY